MKPIVAPAAAVLLGGAGLAALYRGSGCGLPACASGSCRCFPWRCTIGYYGHVFVLFSANAEHADRAGDAAVRLCRGRARMAEPGFQRRYLTRSLMQIANWLSGPAESYATIPLNAAGVAILVYVVVRGRHFDPWLRLIGAAALAQHAVALFYNATIARYHFLTWFLTMLVVMVWLHEVGIDWLKRRYPATVGAHRLHPWSRRLASGLARLQKVSA